MSRNFFESLDHDEVKPPSPRSTGLVFTAVAALLAVIYRGTLPVALALAFVSVLLCALSCLRPGTLAPLNHLWFKLGLAMHRIVNPIVMLVLFGLVIVPAGLIMQRLRDPLQKQRKPAGESYWVALDPARSPTASMRQQF